MVKSVHQWDRSRKTEPDDSSQKGLSMIFTRKKKRSLSRKKPTPGTDKTGSTRGAAMGTWLFLMVLFSASVLPAGQNPPGNIPDLSAPPRKSGPILKMGLHVSKFNTLDPHKAASTSDRILADMMYNGLIRFQPGNSRQMEPDLAIEIPEPVMVRGKQTWTFQLKKGIFFQGYPGEPPDALTALDVCRSFIKAADPQRSAYAGGYEGISVVVTGPYTLRFTLDPPQSPLLFLPKVANYAGGFIVKETVDDRGMLRLKGTGPFYFTEEPDDRHVLLHANETYFRGAPLLKGVDIFFLPDADQRLSAIVDHKADIIVGEPNVEWLRRIKDRKDLRVDSFGVSETVNIFFNTAIPPFSDIRVRKAVAYAVNRNRFLAHSGTGLVQPMFSPVPPYMPGGLTEKEVKSLGLDYATDLNRARELMAEAGVKEGFEMDVVVSKVDSFANNYRTLKDQLAAINITMILHLVDHATMHRFIRHDFNPVVIYEAFHPNTDESLDHFFHSDTAISPGRSPATNFSHYNGIAPLIEKARLERFTSRQIKLWEYAQIKLLEEMVVYPLHHRNQVYIRWDTVDYGHPLISTMALYPQFTEQTTFINAHREITPSHRETTP